MTFAGATICKRFRPGLCTAHLSASSADLGKRQGLTLIVSTVLQRQRQEAVVVDALGADLQLGTQIQRMLKQSGRLSLPHAADTLIVFHFYKGV